eukprot:TRINITY_DN8594_c0_g1_i1.p1 TRINITY_DN8594_c0_g1~~TRINITY_DN8594_c0_g1_i1.p1  ORF type:complete len:122 (-),score=38.14 TRINITY_DN8594_c0_g1_i1:177-542(-)
MSQQMRWVFDHAKEAREKGKVARKDVVKKFSQEVVADRFVEMMERIVKDESKWDVIRKEMAEAKKKHSMRKKTSRSRFSSDWRKDFGSKERLRGGRGKKMGVDRSEMLKNWRDRIGRKGKK